MMTIAPNLLYQITEREREREEKEKKKKKKKSVFFFFLLQSYKKVIQMHNGEYHCHMAARSTCHLTTSILSLSLSKNENFLGGNQENEPLKKEEKKKKKVMTRKKE